MALWWARDANDGCADQRCDRRSCPASGGSQISRRRQEEIANKPPIAMEKQRSRSPTDDGTFRMIAICKLRAFLGSVMILRRIQKLCE
ncbi:hypothetical protein TIFTF001_005454 [Ficus carica]|uniref:Uncharacterized protein n=1 Tax=Ficus carica TaxID=3494 RepID=A0AA88CYN3_FICCA|nr:hypothetical protein TIFTF001_005454 [Ficus carica]